MIASLNTYLPNEFISNCKSASVWSVDRSNLYYRTNSESGVLLHISPSTYIFTLYLNPTILDRVKQLNRLQLVLLAAKTIAG